jgi:peptidyl-prolyl cis-trans isomerase C
VPEVVARVNGQPIRIHQILPTAKAELDRVSVADRERKKPEVLRHALQQYVDRELLLQEALARGIVADSRQVDWAYDQLRREHAGEAAWTEFLAGQGLNPQSVRAELRAQHTVAALLDQELRGGPEAKRGEMRDALLARLRAKARIELLL